MSGDNYMRRMGKSIEVGVGNQELKRGQITKVQSYAVVVGGYEQGIQLTEQEMARELVGGIELSRFPQS